MTEIAYPPGGTKIHSENGRLQIPDRPIVGYIEGDGVGPELMTACRPVWDAAVRLAYGGRRRIHWCELFLGAKAAEKFDGEIFPEATLDAIRDLKVAIKGPLTTPVGSGHRSLNVSLRQALDLYACVRPVRHLPGVPSPMRHPERVDLVIFRENTEDVYAGIEFAAGSPEAESLRRFLEQRFGHQLPPACGLGVKPISERASKRLVRRAIRFALEKGRRSVTLMHKGNIMKHTEGAFRQWGYQVAREEFGDRVVAEQDLAAGSLPEGKVVIKDRIADILFQLLLLRPEDFDVIATPNLNGDYLSDAAAAQVGGVGIAPGANLGDEVAVFEATHGSAPKYAGLNKVNPGSLLLSGAMMLEHLGWNEAAGLIVEAYARTVQDGIVTYDFARQMAGAREVGTREFLLHLTKRMTSLS